VKTNQEFDPKKHIKFVVDEDDMSEMNGDKINFIKSVGMINPVNGQVLQKSSVTLLDEKLKRAGRFNINSHKQNEKKSSSKKNAAQSQRMFRIINPSKVSYEENMFDLLILFDHFSFFTNFVFQKLKMNNHTDALSFMLHKKEFMTMLTERIRNYTSKYISIQDMRGFDNITSSTTLTHSQIKSLDNDLKRNDAGSLFEFLKQNALMPIFELFIKSIESFNRKAKINSDDEEAKFAIKIAVALSFVICIHQRKMENKDLVIEWILDTRFNTRKQCAKNRIIQTIKSTEKMGFVSRDNGHVLKKSVVRLNDKKTIDKQLKCNNEDETFVEQKEYDSTIREHNENVMLTVDRIVTDLDYFLIELEQELQEIKNINEKMSHRIKLKVLNMLFGDIDQFIESLGLVDILDSEHFGKMFTYFSKARDNTNQTKNKKSIVIPDIKTVIDKIQSHILNFILKQSSNISTTSNLENITLEICIAFVSFYLEINSPSNELLYIYDESGKEFNPYYNESEDDSEVIQSVVDIVYPGIMNRKNGEILLKSLVVLK